MAPELWPEYFHEESMSAIDGKKCDVYAAAILYSEILQPHTYGLNERPAQVIGIETYKENWRPPLSSDCAHHKPLIQKMWDADASLRPCFNEVVAALGGEVMPRGKCFVLPFCDYS
jgi:hypothetical protein